MKAPHTSPFHLWARLFWTFLKVNLMTSSGPASVGFIYKEVVGKMMEEERFIEAVGFSNVVPGSEALKLAMFIGYSAGGVGGALAALMGAILPPTVSMLLVALAVQQFQDTPWMRGFTQGIAPALAILIAMAAWKVFHNGKRIRKRAVLLALLSLLALLIGLPPGLVVLLAGISGIRLFR